MRHDRDPIRQTPNMTGPAGRAWFHDLVALKSRDADKPHAAIMSAIVEAPGAHPLWHSYWICVTHLRAVEGLDAPIKLVEAATHEIHVYALNPEVPRQAQLDGDTMHMMVPCNFFAQFASKDDIDAISTGFGCVLDITAGRLNPDTDGRAGWVARFGSVAMDKVRELRELAAAVPAGVA